MKISTEFKGRIQTGHLLVEQPLDLIGGLFVRADDALVLELIIAKILRGEKLDANDKVVLERYYFEINRRVCARP